MRRRTNRKPTRSKQLPAPRQDVFDHWWERLLGWLDCQIRAFGIWTGLADWRWFSR